ncbi:hypothetical protein KAFR_0D01770 [Kazachstania africana CBS 2517]|uniref:Mitochondrial import inner membrane translocase subunit n=1 Tax=Kazachstania africana (strain ATCC 22294 / BCRC 22015 / CBS 2517 / CECT 1963 / NBRC 1671 / NRRL Y-8276) TaxID=1071382 RepID=H2ATX4_KAZAF|nr:hypothetical protein KAFR_0D01770 [Kazachstania africana CBS 2517]CCF57824.1 hypothetical protein KAFR_0D01770 [Kazachstania africana CBS 2517]
MVFSLGRSKENDEINNTASIISKPSPVESLKNQVQQELALANATELVNNITDNCFQKCLSNPYSDPQPNCVDQCLNKYLKAWNTVSKTYIARIQDPSTSGEI